MKEDREPEQFEGCVQQLPVLQLHGVTEGDAKKDEVEDEEDAEDGKDVELVSRVVIVQEVPGLPVSQPELVPQSESLGNVSQIFL